LEDWKIKIAVLWLVLEFGMFTVPVVEMYIPNFVENAVEQTTPEMLVFMAFMVMIPPLMAFLSLTLKDSTNRWANIILAIVFAALMPIGVIDVPIGYIAPMILIAIVEIIALALIIRYAWRSKQKA
jgi:hypothetical protein